jgi:hypothetical protein
VSNCLTPFLIALSVMQHVKMPEVALVFLILACILVAHGKVSGAGPWSYVCRKCFFPLEESFFQFAEAMRP